MLNEICKILSLSVNIVGDGYDKYSNMKIRYDYENTAIDNALRDARFRDNFRMESCHKTYLSELGSRLLKCQPAILHIACPANDNCLLFPVNPNTKELCEVNADSMIRILKNAGCKDLQLIVLRAFPTTDFAARLAEESGAAVLCMSKNDTIENCAEFLSAFYELLANGMTISQAYHLSKCVSASRAFCLVQKKRSASAYSFIPDTDPDCFAMIMASSPIQKIEDALPGLPVELDKINSDAPSLEIKSIYPGSKREIVMQLAYHRPEVVHLSSHACIDYIAFYTANGEKILLEKFWLIHVFKQFRHIVRCVVLNSCSSSLIAKRISEYIDYVVGTVNSIFDGQAVVFSQSFYHSLNLQQERYSEKDYYKAYYTAFCQLLILQSFYGPLYHRMYMKKDYKQDEYQNLENRMLEAEEGFLERYPDLRDEKINELKMYFADWYFQFKDNPGVERQVQNLLRHFSYYSEEKVDKLLKILYQNLLQEEKIDEGYTIYCPLPSRKNRMNSSFEYWMKFRQINRINKGNCIPVIDGHEKQLAAVKTVVFIDDFIGSGQTFIEYMKEHRQFLQKRLVIYVTIHSMTQGRNAIKKAAKEENITLKFLTYTTAKKAFQIYKVKKHHKKEFEDYCRNLKIAEERILGYGKTEALCGFYNNIPNNDLGIFFDDSEPFIPLFTRDKSHGPAFTKAAKSVPDKILDYYQRSSGQNSFEELYHSLEVQPEEFEHAMDELFDEGKLVSSGTAILPANKRKIVVFGGSFNPPTLAHKKVLSETVEKLDADYGMFVPSSYSYVAGKFNKQKEIMPPFSEKVRKNMLEKYTHDNQKLLVNTCEYGDDGKGHSYDTMCRIQKDNPNAELIFLIGADKLDIVPRWHNIDDFLRKFYIAVIARDGQDPEERIVKDSYLSKYKDRFYVIHQNDTLPVTSSSMARKAYLGGDTLTDFLVPDVEQLVRENMPVITRFRDENYYLSNFYDTPVAFGGLVYQNAEAAFQAQKCKTAKEREQFCHLSGREAKALGRTVELRPDWEEEKLYLMHEIVKAKFEQNPELKRLLKETKQTYLIEGNDWNDTFWGADRETWTGTNYLGKILMEVRSIL